MDDKASEDVQPKGHEIVEGDDKHPSGRKKKRSCLDKGGSRKK